MFIFQVVSPRTWGIGCFGNDSETFRVEGLGESRACSGWKLRQYVEADDVAIAARVAVPRNSDLAGLARLETRVRQGLDSSQSEKGNDAGSELHDGSSSLGSLRDVCLYCVCACACASG
jgi:hypothetical protein